MAVVSPRKRASAAGTCGRRSERNRRVQPLPHSERIPIRLNAECALDPLVVAFSNGKPASTFPENALTSVQASLQRPRTGKAPHACREMPTGKGAISAVRLGLEDL